MPRYTPEQLHLRNTTIWTKVQFILAPIQFVVFLIGVILTFAFSKGYIKDFTWVTVALAVKTSFLFALMFTGMFWEKLIFDKWIYGPEFYWEDVGSTIACAVHTSYFIAIVYGTAPETLIIIAYLSYLSYVLNAAQYLVRLYLEKQNEKRLRREMKVSQ
jgi:3-vinyl bacteriochlorophyllide hydratase